MSLATSRARLGTYLEMVPESKRQLFEQLCDELAFIEAKLEETRRSLEDAPLVINGEKMPHRNAGFDAYNALFSSYLKGLSALNAAILEGKQATDGDSGDDEPAQPQSRLSDFRARLRVA